ncbi:hypothetical protein HALLA_01765 (plasmid) [Halostagnicola larsenii XH-48]|uniref:Uncharacterized protein n=1 Tax=Halostagnicola larsenii XH-48 TaxID=797299 RepID=W0JXW6_9EURY|nr:hypothetical protein [Halostagnicola larsenii]AHG02055.1 hypothetical protein HALLA_01765 [Halostagnicola larsenii XH-48]
MSKSSMLLDLVCAQRDRMKALFALLVASGLFLALSAVFVRPGDDAFPILIIDTVLVVGALAFFGATHRYCTKRAMDE